MHKTEEGVRVCGDVVLLYILAGQRRWTTLTGKFLPRPNYSIKVWTKISGKFGMMESTFSHRGSFSLGCHAVLLWGGALCDDSKNSCIGGYNHCLK